MVEWHCLIVDEAQIWVDDFSNILIFIQNRVL